MEEQEQWNKDYDKRIVIDCPVCHRTIWNGAMCNHGLPPEPLIATDLILDDKEEFKDRKRRKSR